MDREILLIRNFIAIPIRDDIKNEILLYLSEYKKSNRNIKWVNNDNYHITLFFASASTKEEIERIGKIMREEIAVLKKFVLRVGGIGVFPNVKKTRVFWVGVKTDEVLFNFRKKILNRINKDIVKDNQSNFHPHITIGRIKKGNLSDDLIYNIQNGNNKLFGEQIVDKIVHYKSELTQNGAIHSVINTYMLK